MEKKEIDRLRKKYDLTKDRDILALYDELQSGTYDLTGPEGRAFDDEVYDLAVAARKRAARQTEPRTGSGKKARNFTGSEREKKSAKRSDVLVLTRKEFMVRRVVILLLFAVMAGCLFYFGIYVADYKRAANLSESIARKKDNKDVQAMFADRDVTAGEAGEGGGIAKPQVLDAYKSLYMQNKNLIGWLAIADTNIDYPVMQTDDNSYYLNHDINQKEDKNGTLFLDSQCDVLRPSTNLIIYGHNMRSGNMFGTLDKYKSEDYYKKHPVINFDSIYEKGEYEVMYAFNSKVYAQDEIVFKYYQFIDVSGKEEFDSNMRAMADMALYDTGVTAEYGDRLLTLSTCDYLEDDSRFVVVARKVD